MINVVFEHPTSDQTAEAAVDPDHTPQNLVDFLIEEHHFLAPPKPETAYGVMNTRSAALLDLNTGFGDQDVQDKDRLKITIDALGAAPDPARLRMDFASGKSLVAQKGCVTGFAAYMDRTKKQKIEDYDQSHLATFYLVRYEIQLPVNPREYYRSFVFSFDLATVMDNYPDSDIHVVYAASNPKPWHHRIQRNSGYFCHGGHRDAGFLLGDTIVQIARMLNFAEPKHLLAQTTDRGFDTEAFKHYDRVFGGPVHPQLKIPEITSEGLLAFQSDRDIKLTINGRKPAPPQVKSAPPSKPQIKINKPR